MPTIHDCYNYTNFFCPERWRQLCLKHFSPSCAGQRGLEGASAPQQGKEMVISNLMGFCHLFFDLAKFLFWRWHLQAVWRHSVSLHWLADTAEAGKPQRNQADSVFSQKLFQQLICIQKPEHSEDLATNRKSNAFPVKEMTHMCVCISIHLCACKCINAYTHTYIYRNIHMYVYKYYYELRWVMKAAEDNGCYLFRLKSKANSFTDSQESSGIFSLKSKLSDIDQEILAPEC